MTTLQLLAVKEGYETVQEMLKAGGSHVPAICQRCGHVMNLPRWTHPGGCDECGSGNILIASQSFGVRQTIGVKRLGNPKQPR